MRKLLFLLPLAFFACKQKDTRPDDVLPPGRMSAVLRQVFLADEWSSMRAEKDSTFLLFRENVALYRGIFKKESITEEQFRRSLRWYQDHPVELRPVMDSLVKGPMLEVKLADTVSSDEQLTRQRQRP